MKLYAVVVILYCDLVASPSMVKAHDGHGQMPKAAVLIHTTIPNNAVVAPPEIAAAFEPFAKMNALRYRQDNRFFYVESNGMPDHPMMIGIRAWQQQVPLPQLYTGANAWQIPLIPVPAKEPLSTKNRFLRGAIALAVNGIPIFNPLNNRGDDAYLFGELDEYGIAHSRSSASRMLKVWPSLGC